MIEDIYKRSKILSKTCIKIALVLPHDKPMTHVIRNPLIEKAATLTIQSKGLMMPNLPDFFKNNILLAREAANGCNFWLELVKEEGLISSDIIDPIIEESALLARTFSVALKSVKTDGYLG